MEAIRVTCNVLPISEALLLVIKCYEKNFLNDPWIKNQITENLIQQMIEADLSDEPKPMRLKWLFANGLLKAHHLSMVMSLTAAQGNIVYVKWARGNRAPWDRFGQLEVLE
jgi:hypothetical protein